MQEILLFLISSLALTLMPGPDILFVINQSVVNKKHGIITSLGLCSGLVFHTMFLVFGVSTIIQLNNDFIIYLKYFGAIYVLYLGFTELKSNIKSNENINSKNHKYTYRSKFTISYSKYSKCICVSKWLLQE